MTELEFFHPTPLSDQDYVETYTPADDEITQQEINDPLDFIDPLQAEANAIELSALYEPNPYLVSTPADKPASHALGIAICFVIACIISCTLFGNDNV